VRDVSDTEDIRHVIELREIKQRVLRDLERQAARFAGQVPTHISIELEQTRQDIKLLDERLQIIPHSQEAVDAVGGDALAITINYQLKALDSRLSEALQRVLNAQIRIEASSDEWRRNEREIRQERQTEHDERMTAVEDQVRTLFELVERLGDRFDGIIWTVIGIVVASSVLTFFILWLAR
jgi:hypothetical protein